MSEPAGHHVERGKLFKRRRDERSLFAPVSVVLGQADAERITCAVERDCRARALGQDRQRLPSWFVAAGP